MGRFIARRLVQAIPTLLGIMLLTFLLTRAAPSDPVNIMVAGAYDLTPEDRAELRHSLGLDEPLPVQFVTWAGKVLQLDFGNSFYYKRPVIQLIAERIPNSLQLQLTALVVALLIGVPLGVIAGLRRGGVPDHSIRVGSVVVHAVPAFWFGLIIVLIFGVELRWLPIGSMNAIGKEKDIADRLWHMIGPVTVLALGPVANYSRFLRTEVLETLGQDFVRTARAKGLRERTVTVTHVLRNSLIPVVTLLGGILTIIVGGSVVIEQIFNWPGLGRLIFEGVQNKDYPLVQASVLVGSFLLVLSYILRDVAYAWVDPRIKVR